MRKSTLGRWAAMASCVLLLAACDGAAGTATTNGSAGTVALLLPGTTGDGGFLDQSAQGVRAGAEDTGWKSKVVEAGYEPTKWQPALEDLANGGNDVTITGTFAMIELVEQAAAQHPDSKFVLFDAEPNPANCGGCKNVYSITYRYDETGFLAGALAGYLEKTSGVERIKGTGVVGVVGGQDIPVINDYINGFKAGVAAVAPDVKVLSAYAGSFADPVKGRAVAQDMVRQGAEILFTAAGSTDKGVIEAAAANNVWALGNASSQAMNPKVNATDAVLTASDTNVASSLQDAVKLAAAGQLPLGSSKTFGVKEGAVSITDSDVYKRVVPADVREKITAMTADVANGKYESAFAEKK